MCTKHVLLELNGCPSLFSIPEFQYLIKHCLQVLCREYGGATYDFQDAFVYWIDRFGFNICARGYEVFDPVKFSKAAHEPDSLTQPQWIVYRMPFPVPMGRPEDAMAAINEAVAEIINRKPPS